jgi:hypothetical protein
MNEALAQLKALRREKLRPQELTKPTKDPSVSFVRSEGSSLHGDGKASVSFVSAECRQDYKGQPESPSAPVDEVEKRTQHINELTKPTKDTSASFVSSESDRPLGKHSDLGAQSIELTNAPDATRDVADHTNERTAIAEHDGGVPALYAGAFATLQVACPVNVPRECWRQAIEDAGLFLGQWGREAERLGWQIEETIWPS